METKAIGHEIKQRRKVMNLTQKELGQLIGKTESSIQKYESGLTEIPINVLGKIAHHLGVEITDFLDVKSIITIEANQDSALMKYLSELGYIFTDDPENSDYSIVYYNGYHYKIAFETVVRDVVEMVRFQAQYAMDRLLEKAEKLD